jgi:hypothetical protein
MESRPPARGRHDSGCAVSLSRVGTTDSEALFLTIMGQGGTRDPLGATERVLQTVTHMAAEGPSDQFRFTAALTNGRYLYAFRYAAHDSANTLYFRESSQELLVVSEPLDAQRDRWTEVPEVTRWWRARARERTSSRFISPATRLILPGALAAAGEPPAALRNSKLDAEFKLAAADCRHGRERKALFDAPRISRAQRRRWSARVSSTSFTQLPW